MTTQDFLSKLDGSQFSEETRSAIRAAIGDTTEFTIPLRAQVLDLMQAEIDRDFGDIEPGPEGTAVEEELSAKLTDIEQEAQADIEAVEREVQSMADLCQKLDVIERLHAKQ